MISKICRAIKHLLSKESKFIGRDKNGNSYYESSKGKRWVVYSGVLEPTTLSPEWHTWLHYTDSIVPLNNKKGKVKHAPDLTDTEYVYYQNHKVKNHYEGWNPSNK